MVATQVFNPYSCQFFLVLIQLHCVTARLSHHIHYAMMNVCTYTALRVKQSSCVLSQLQVRSLKALPSNRQQVDMDLLMRNTMAKLANMTSCLLTIKRYFSIINWSKVDNHASKSQQRALIKNGLPVKSTPVYISANYSFHNLL
jgi:hypothetical protein